MKGLKTKTVVLIIVLLSNINFNLNAQCLNGNCIDGYGILQTSNGDKYIGEFEDGTQDGEGLCLYKSGATYAGSWKNGKFNGEGRYKSKDGETIAGIWKEGKFIEEQQTDCILGDCQNGFGIYLYPNGMKYLGEFENGETIGRATTFYPNGSKFLGTLLNGKRHGLGTFYEANGNITEGFWETDNLLGSAKKGNRCVDGNCDNGFGVYVYDDNTIYEGDFKKGLADGKGTCYYADGDRYKGEWGNHTYNGNGTLFTSDGRIYKGEWQAGQLMETEEPSALSTTVNITPKVWALVIGVARYQGMRSLRYTDDDAYRMYAFLKSPEGGALPDNQIAVLVDENASKTAILKKMKSLYAQANANDVILFYFSGHGEKGKFLTSDAEEIDNKLLHSEVMDIIENSKAKGKIVIADACHSGSIGSSGYLFAQKGKDAESTINNYYRAFSISSGGTALLLSSKANEFSIENYGLRQGIFSHYLVNGLKGGADVDGNRIITVNELFNHVEKNVRAYSNNIQTPIILGDYDKNMPLGIVR